MHTTTTGCQGLDRLLDGGLESDAITLVFGEGGSGKTNLALQCARAVAAAGQRVAYVDTEGVSQKRLSQVFDALPDEERAAAEERLLFFSPYTIEQQEQMVKRTSLLRDVGLIVVDSINMHYRLHIDGPGTEKEASRSLYQQLHHLTMHARQHHTPVLITGQVYGGEDATQPFARRVMEHLVKALVRFEKRPDGTRRATILKHRSIEEGRQTRFRIGAHGLEDLDGTMASTPAPAPKTFGSSAAQQRSGDDDSDDARHDASQRMAGTEEAHRSASQRMPDQEGEANLATGEDEIPDQEGEAETRHDASQERPGTVDEDEARRDADAWGVDHPDPEEQEPGQSGFPQKDARQDPHHAAAKRPTLEPAQGYPEAGPELPSEAERGLSASKAPSEPEVRADGQESPEAPEAKQLQDSMEGASVQGFSGSKESQEAPASSLLTPEERREAEALPGFAPAAALDRASGADGDA